MRSPCTGLVYYIMVDAETKNLYIKVDLFRTQTDKRGGETMCPHYNPSKKECRVTPYDSSALQSDSKISSDCASSNHTNCGNYEAFKRGDYKVER